jgi:hypothetical protein
VAARDVDHLSQDDRFIAIEDAGFASANLAAPADASLEVDPDNHAGAIAFGHQLWM